MKKLIQLEYHLLNDYLARHPELPEKQKERISEKLFLLRWEYQFLLKDEDIQASASGDPLPPPPPPPPPTYP